MNPADRLAGLRRTLLAIAVAALGYTGFVYLETARHQRREELVFDQPASRRRPAPSLVGRIVIPRLGVRAVVEEGVDARTLRCAVGHVPGTALPGEDGNVALAAHRDTFFRGLRDARRNDTIRVETLSRRIEYVVDSLQVVSPQDVRVLSPTQGRVLTLVTCYPFNYVGSAPKRFIVRARQVSVSLREPPGS